jgi:FkbM family methyltransferase
VNATGQSPLVVLDVGARGGAPERWHGLGHPVVVCGFEPDAGACRELNEAMAATPNGPDVPLRCYPIALAEAAGPRTLYLYRDRRLSSFLRPNSPWLRAFPVDRLLSDGAFLVDHETTVTCMTMDEFCDRHGFTEVDFIKLDTQGSELEILRGGAQALRRAFAVEVEVEFVQEYLGQALFGEVDAFLRGHGFQLFDLSRQWWKRDVPDDVVSRGQLIFGDAVYMRDLLAPEQAVAWLEPAPPKVKLMKTILIAGRLGYSDYALQLLDAYRAEGLIEAADHAAWNGAFVVRRPAAPPARRSWRRRALEWLIWRLEPGLMAPPALSARERLHHRYFDSDAAGNGR